MDQPDTAPTAAPTFHVGYDNGYGYRAVDAPTEAMTPVEGSALASGAAATAPYRAVGLTAADAHRGEPAAPAPVADPSFAQTTAIPVTELAPELAAARDATDAPATPAVPTRSPSGRRVARSKPEGGGSCNLRPAVPIGMAITVHGPPARILWRLAPIDA